MIIIRINYVKAQAMGITGALLLAHQILLKRVDVGIAVVDGRGITVLHHPLDDGSAARCATCMEEYFHASSVLNGAMPFLREHSGQIPLAM